MSMNLPIIDSTRGIARTPIEWADYAVGSPFRFRDKATGDVLRSACVKVSSGCANCYAEQIGLRFKTGRAYTKAVMDGLECVLDQGVIDHMLSFKPKPPKGETMFKGGRSRPTVFFGDTTDIFGEWVSFEQLDVLFACFALRPDVDWLLLTKRPERMAEYMTRREISKAWSPSPRGGGGGSDESAKWKTPCDRVYTIVRNHPGHERDALLWPLPNVWLGTSIESDEYHARAWELLRCLSAVRFLSLEPLVAPVDLNKWELLYRAWIEKRTTIGTYIDWVIVGGESGRGARPCYVAWIRSIVRQCRESGVPCFVKQLGSWPMTIGRMPDGRHRLKDRKGGDMAEWPEDLRVREWPKGSPQ